MLLISTVVRPSTIEGLGLHAAETIPAGTRIYTWDDRFGWSCSPEEFDRLPTEARAFVERYGWRDAGSGRWRASVDNSRFLNHSATPNTEHRADGQYTTRRIVADEEITEDYSQFDPDFGDYAASLR